MDRETYFDYIDAVVDGDLTDVSDEALTTVLRGVAQLSRDLRREEGDDSEAALVALGLTVKLDKELWKRREALEDARVALDANGHEVFVGFDPNAFGRGQGGWSALCYCSHSHLDPGYLRTRDEAVEVAGTHAVKHGGRWDLDSCDPEGGGPRRFGFGDDLSQP